MQNITFKCLYMKSGRKYGKWLTGWRGGKPVFGRSRHAIQITTKDM